MNTQFNEQMNQQMNQQQMPAPGQQMNSTQMPSNLSHGGHEVFDVQEVLTSTIGVLDQYMMFRTFVKDQQLLNILDRQYSFLTDQYNILCECFNTGSKPSHGTKVYNMQLSNNVTYGFKPSQPKKPMQSINEVSDQGISGHMLGLMKSQATMLTTASLEATNPVVRRVLADSVPNVVEMAYELFLYQNQHAYYQVPQLAQQDMQKMMSGFAPANGQPQMPQAGQMYQN